MTFFEKLNSNETYYRVAEIAGIALSAIILAPYFMLVLLLNALNYLVNSIEKSFSFKGAEHAFSKR